MSRRIGLHQTVRRMFAWLGLLLLLAAALPSQAQTLAPLDSGGSSPATLPTTDKVRADIVNALVSRLSEEETRTLLVERLDGPAAAVPASGAGTLRELAAFGAEAVRRISASAVFNSSHASAYLAAEVDVVRRFFDGMGSEGTWQALRAVALALVLGLAAELAVRRLAIARHVRPTLPVGAGNLVAALRRDGLRLWHEVLGTLTFALVAMIALLSMNLEPSMAAVPALLFFLVVVPRFGIALMRFFFVPGDGAARLLSVDDRTARFLYRNFVAMVCAIGVTVAIGTLNTAMGGLPGALTGGFRFWLNVVFFGWLLVIYISARDGWRSIMRAGREALSPFEAWSVRIYPWLAVVVILLTWAFCVTVNAMGMSSLISGERHFISLVIILVAPLLDTLINAVARFLLPAMKGEGRLAEKAHAASLNAYVRMGRVLVFGTVMLATARLWHLTPLGVASAGVGERLATQTVQVGLIIVVGYLAWEIARLLFNMRLADERPGAETEHAHETEEGATAAPTSRLGTILPPISKAVQAMILSLTLLTVLANLGIDVTALLAGAGIVGIAIGFGAQKLVSDVISGVFFMVDDAFRLNEYIDVGGPVGTVERISLRSIRLRDPKGPVLVVPYNEIKTVTNFGRDWGIMKMRFTLTFDTDVERVRKIFKKIGQEMLDDPVLGPGFISPFKSQGVYEFNEYGIVLRGKFTHAPGAQFAIRKQIYTRVKEEFEKANIQFARREVKVLVSAQGGQAESEAAKVGPAAAAAAAKGQVHDATGRQAG